jgi:hypothetical protein
MSRTTRERGDAILKLLETPKEPEVIQTLLSGQRENHEKYSAPFSAAMRNSWEATCGGGGLSATKVNFRW